jgi:putative ABC transport system substrate-binding protein
VTGSSSGAAETAIKIVELVRELLPRARRVAVMAHVTDPFARPFLAQIELGGRMVGIATEPIMIGPDREVEPAFADIRGMQADAVVLQGSVLRKGIGELALRHRLPSFSPLKQLPEAGGLASYSAKVEPLYGETAGYVDRILKGAKPADLPVTFPTQFELVVNVKTAKALDLGVPEAVLVRADKLIE